MTMAKVENGAVIEIGLPADKRGTKVDNLMSAGWFPVHGTERPTQTPEPGYQWTYGSAWSVDGDRVFGTWSQTQRPQPYASWSWADGEGWVPPTPKPDDAGDYVWDEDANQWVNEPLL